MGSLNRVELIGNLGKQPEIKQVNNGNKVATFTLATTEPAHTMQNGTQVQEKTEWHNIVAWGGNASIAERFLKKGQQVYIEGKMRTRMGKNATLRRLFAKRLFCSPTVEVRLNNHRYKQHHNRNLYNRQQRIITAMMMIYHFSLWQQ